MVARTQKPAASKWVHIQRWHSSGFCQNSIFLAASGAGSGIFLEHKMKKSFQRHWATPSFLDFSILLSPVWYGP